MDGNNRWSKKKNLNKFNGYKAGVKSLLKIADYLFNNKNISYISAFALSKNNLKRPKSFIKILKNILIDFLNNETKLQSSKNYNIRFIGDRNFLSKEIKSKIEYIENVKNNSKNYLIIYLNYSGKQDIIKAAKKFKFSKSTNQPFSKFLSTSKFPSP